MQSFNPNLKAGELALVVGVSHPENSHLIGKTVRIEALCDVGDSVQKWYDPLYTVFPLRFAMAIVIGIGTGKHHKEGFSTIKQKYLMPLPPLDDDVIIGDTEQPKEAVKC